MKNVAVEATIPHNFSRLNTSKDYNSFFSDLVGELFTYMDKTYVQILVTTRTNRELQNSLFVSRSAETLGGIW